MYGRLLSFEKRCVLSSYIILFVKRVRGSLRDEKIFSNIWEVTHVSLPILNSQSVFVRARENPKHKQTAQRRLLTINYINKISNAISVTPCLSSELSS